MKVWDQTEGYVVLKFQVCRTLQTEYMGARSCCFFSEKYTIIYLFVGIFMIYLQGTLISSKPSIIELNQFANLIEKLHQVC